MVVNLLMLLIVIAITIGAGWLTWRAVRAKRLWVKVVGGLAAGLLTLVFAAAAFTGGKGIAAIYFSGAKPAPDLKVAGSAEQVARGEYLVNLSCVGCHGAADAIGNPSGKSPLSGGWNIAEAEGLGFVGAMITENLTPGGKLAGYSDGEIFRVMRHSIDKEGRRLGFMAFLPYGQLSDEDTQAIIAYLRSLPPAETGGATGDQLNFIGMLLFGSGMIPPPAPAADQISAPPQGVTVEYGKYVATFGECAGCHGPDVSGIEATSMSPAVPNPRPIISTWTQEQFAEAMHTGVRPGGAPFSEAMPWQNASKMTDDDLAALYLYLTTPVK
ncbi:MAG: c-type cytochrome [Anaerolineaceae bacterium]|nr:c-type cytochrome [Anaerolineaceae bacterium]